MLYRVIIVAIVSLFTWAIFVGGVPVADKACDINARNESCPDDYCCVRDEFVYSETYCRQYGMAGKPCGTKPSQFECPCEPGYRCASNIHGHVTSLFGTCFPIPDLTTESTLDSVTTNILEMDTTTADYTVHNEGTTEIFSNKETTRASTTEHVKYSGQPGLVG